MALETYAKKPRLIPAPMTVHRREVSREGEKAFNSLLSTQLLYICATPLKYFLETNHLERMPLQNLQFNNALSNDKKAILQFFIRLSVLFTVWFFVYNLLLTPGRIIDKPVTDIITIAVVKCINIISPTTEQVSWVVNKTNVGNNLIQHNDKAFGIYDVCNGIDLMFIYISILVLLPYSAKRKIIFSLAGIAIITLANIIRVCALYFIYVYQKNAFDFSHHYLFTILMYVLIFYGWLLFVKKKQAL